MLKHGIAQAMESINFQSKMFGRNIELIVDEIKDFTGTAKELNDSKLKTKLEEVIKFNSGIQVVIEFNTGMVAVKIPIFTADHLFFEDYYKTLQKESVKQFYKAIEKYSNRSTIDLKNAKISGVLSSIAIPFYLSFDFIKNKKLTSEHITATILHEVGHAFTLFEYSNRMAKTNQALALVSKSIMNRESDTDRVIYLRKASEMITGREDSFKDYEKIKNIAIITDVFLKTTKEKACSELNTDNYDDVACEYLADQYVARHGYSRALVENLDILGSNYNVFEYKHRPIILVHLTSILSGFFNIFVILNPGIILTIPVIGVIVYIFNFFILYYKIFSSGYSDKDYAYDDLFIRFKRNKEQIVNYLKDINIDKETKKTAIEDIEKIENIMKNIRQYESIFEKLSLLFSKKSRDTKRSIELQNDLEALASNDLFTRAAKLTTLTST